MKKVAIVQSNYIPWKGYFDMINMVDEFVLFDEVQYTKRDWRNRNIIKTPEGLIWLTIPVEVKGKYLQKISETKIADNTWQKKHWNSIKTNYSKSEYFHLYAEVFEELYLNCGEEYLSRINDIFLSKICNLLDISTNIKFSSDVFEQGERNEQLINICRKLQATDYLSGPAAKDYIDEEEFQKYGIRVHWMDYTGYPEYRQLYPPFEHGVSILDLLFNEGTNAKKFMKSYGI